jgi:hypothetical protein
VEDTDLISWTFGGMDISTSDGERWFTVTKRKLSMIKSASTNKS